METTTMEDDATTDLDEVKLKLSELEQENYVLKEKLDESKLAVDRINKDNEDLKAAYKAIEKSALENTNNSLLIEKERESLMVDKMRYQSEASTLKTEKEVLEGQITRLLSEKRSLFEDIEILKDDHQKSLQKIAKLQTDVDDFQTEKTLFQRDKERWAQEKELYGKTQEWYINELADREKAVSSLRLQIVQLERDGSLKKAELDNSMDEFTLKNETLIAKAEDLENECNELRERNMELSNENRAVVESISTEIQVKERLISTYKKEIQSLKEELESSKIDGKQLQEALEEKEAALIQISEENKRISEEARDQVAGRELKILHLQEELDKTNEHLKFGLNALPGSFSASLAELLSTGTSLTSIYAQYTKVLADLAEEKQKQKDLEEYVRTLMEDLKKNAPNVLQIRQENDALTIENRELRQQLKYVSGEKDKFKSEAETIARELKFTRTELCSAQNENSTLKKQVQKLLYVAEMDGSEVDLNVSQDDMAIFSNIRELHERNIDLINQLEEMKQASEESDKEAKAEIDNLQCKLSEFSHEIEMLRNSQEKAAFIIQELEHQRDACREELENRQPSPLKSFNTSRSFVEPELANNEWKTKCDKLEEKLLYIVDDKQKTEEALNNRVDSQMELISQLRLTNGRLESDLEYQKKNQDVAFKKVNELEKEISKKNEQIAKYKAQMESEAQKVNKLTNELNLKLDEIANLNVNYQVLNDKYDVARNNAISYEAQLKVLQESRQSAERMNLTLEGLENLLRANENEKLEQMKSQLDVISMERDRYKNAVEELQSNAKLQRAFGNDMEVKETLQNEMKHLREQYAILEQLLEKTKTENQELLKKLNEMKTNDIPVDGLNKEIHLLRNKNLYLEKQLADYRHQINQLKAQLDSKEKELMELRKLTGTFENTMKTQDEQLQQQREGPAATSASEDTEKLNAEIAKQKESINQFRKAAHKYRDESAAHVRTITDLNAKISELESQKKQPQIQAATAIVSSLLPNAPQRMKQMMTENNSLKAVIADKETEVNTFKTEIATLNERIQALTQENEATKKHLEEAQKKISESLEMNMRIKSLTNAFETLKSKTEQQDLELKKLKTERDNAIQAMNDAAANASQSRKRTLQQDSVDVSFEVPAESLAKKSRVELEDAEEENFKEDDDDDNFAEDEEDGFDDEIEVPDMDQDDMENDEDVSYQQIYGETDEDEEDSDDNDDILVLN